MKNYLTYKGMFAQSSGAVKFIIAVSVFFLCSFIFSELGLLFMKFISDKIIAMEVFQLMAALGGFVFSALAISYLISPKPFEYLSIKKTNGYFFIMSVICIVVAIPFINFTTILNENLTLPDWMSAIEKCIKELEKQQSDIANSFLEKQSFSMYLFNLFVIALIPAVGEELLFRGLIQKALYHRTKNVHIAIWCTGILFSAIHLQFYGFFPRMFMGVLFGYFVAWSGSLWVSMACHFMNNALIITSKYLYPTAEETFIESFGSRDIILAIVSFILIITICYFIQKTRSEESEYKTT
ncbi:MAG: CPBP family intramembrane metalloprotease [Paludibacteraceae bacterium]|nr:CPBP family intramembrane metalloprotease [Paludibacteraceae bacterium]